TVDCPVTSWAFSKHRGFLGEARPMETEKDRCSWFTRRLQSAYGRRRTCHVGKEVGRAFEPDTDLRVRHESPTYVSFFLAGVISGESLIMVDPEGQPIRLPLTDLGLAHRWHGFVR